MIRIGSAYSHDTVRGGAIPQHKSYLVKNIFNMKKFIIFFLFIFVENIYAATFTCRGTATLACSGAGYTGQCVLSGEGDCHINSNLNIDTLTVTSGTLSTALNLTAGAAGNNRIGKIIIQRKSGTGTQFSLNAYNKELNSLTVGDIVLGEGVDEANVLVVRFSSDRVRLENTGLSKDATGAYIPRKEASGGGEAVATQEVNSLHLKTQHQSNYSNQ